MIDAARKAAKAMRRDFNEVSQLQVSRKGPADFVTAADLKAEQTLFEELSRVRPGYGFIGEERGRVEGSDRTHTWIVDPIDGTTNFVHAIPHFAISIALEREGVIVAGVIYNPIVNDLFWGEKGRGAFLNNEVRLRVSARTRLEDCVIATGIPFKGRPGQTRFLKELHAVAPQVSGVRRFGAASLDMAWVAAGRYDAYWERDVSQWDVAAGVVIVQEAGGMVTDADGEPNARGAADGVLAANLDLHPRVLERLKAAA